MPAAAHREPLADVVGYRWTLKDLGTTSGHQEQPNRNDSGEGVRYFVSEQDRQDCGYEPNSDSGGALPTLSQTVVVDRHEKGSGSGRAKKCCQTHGGGVEQAIGRRRWRRRVFAIRRWVCKGVLTGGILAQGSSESQSQAPSYSARAL